MQFEIEKDAPAEVAHRAHNLRTGRDVELQPDFEKAGVRRELAHQREGLGARREVERHDDALAGGLISAACQFIRFHTGLREPMQLFAPAKINLSFKILRLRADGFHEIDTLMAPISLRDELTIESDESGNGISFTTDDPTLPPGEDNLVVRAARSFFATISEERGVRIMLRKKIPHGAGLGGGSSDAASTLLGLNELCGQPLTPDRLTNPGGSARIGRAIFPRAKRGPLSRTRGDRGSGSSRCRRYRFCF